MIVGIGHLFMQIKENIAKIRDVRVSGFIDAAEVSLVNNRAAQICALDIILAEHRKKHGSRFNGLNGKQALHHIILLKYHWPLSAIRELSLADALLSLHDELQLESLPDEPRKYLTQIINTQYPVNFPDYLEAEWDPNLSEKFLTEIE